jgi:CheY-like chemotaxis protein
MDSDDALDPKIAARLLKRVQALEGGPERLAERLGIAPLRLAQWVEAKSALPLDVFESVIEIVLEAHEQRFVRSASSAGGDKPQLLLANSPQACTVLAGILGDELTIVPAHTFADAARILGRDRIDVIVCGQHFEGSQMLRLLEHVKADERTRHIPFVCCRVLPTMLHEPALKAMREACEALGAVAYVDLARIRSTAGPEVAAVEFRDAVRAAASLQSKKPVRVLVADDNEDAVHTLGVLLQMAGHEVRQARDGTEALRVAAMFRPEVAVLDLAMPQISGYKVAQRIRAEPWGDSVVLIALTGSSKREDATRVFKSGFDYHFRKPVKVEHLLEVFQA